MTKWIVATAVAVVMVWGVVGCNKSTTQASTGGAVAGAVKAQTVCPVSGDKIDKALFADANGKRVYFCCAACLPKFKEDPAKYIKKMEDQGIVLEKAPEAAK